jgi:predicted MFS family arabinose efflux permease
VLRLTLVHDRLLGVLIGLLPPVFQTRLLRAAPPGREAAVGAVGVAALNLGIAAGATAGGAVVDLAGVQVLPVIAAGIITTGVVLLGAAAFRAGRTVPPGPAAGAAPTRGTPPDHVG